MIPYVNYVSDNVSIKNVDINTQNELIKIGAEHGDDANYLISYHNQNELALLFEKINNMGIAFSGGSGWSPSEMFEMLREKGLLHGKYKKIVWHNQSKFEVFEL